MDSYTILYFLDQLCENDLINQLTQNQLQENWAEMERLIQNKLCLENQKPSIEFQDKIIAIRNLQFSLIQRNDKSVRHTIAQLEKLEENMMLLINKLQYNNPIRAKIRLIATSLSQVKENLKKIALLEMKQIIVFLLSAEIVDTELNDLLKRIKINYRFFLGYEVSEGLELNTFSQIVYKKNCLPIISRETRIESIIYHRRMNATKKCNEIIASKINETTFETLKEEFSKWKKQFIENPITNESFETICTLWYKNLEEVKQILLEKTYKDTQLEGQLDLWNYQKTKEKSLL